MTSPYDLRAQAERCRVVGSRFGGEHRIPMQLLANQLDAQALAAELDRPGTKRIVE